MHGSKITLARGAAYNISIDPRAHVRTVTPCAHALRMHIASPNIAVGADYAADVNVVRGSQSPPAQLRSFATHRARGAGIVTPGDRIGRPLDHDGPGRQGDPGPVLWPAIR